MPKRKHKSQLQAILNFTDDDLEANREGYFTQSQENTLRIIGIFKVLIFCIPLILVIIFGIVQLSQPINVASRGADYLPFACFLVPSLALALIFGGLEWHPFHKDLQSDIVLNVAGTIEFSKFRRKDGHPIRVESLEFVIPSDLHKELKKLSETQAQWIIYYATNSKTILSAEPLDATTANSAREESPM